MGSGHVEKKLHILAAIILGGFISAQLYHHYIPAIFGWGYPDNTYLFTPRDMFADWANLARKVGAGNPYLIQPESAPFVYFPFAYLLLLPFSSIPRHFFLPGFVVANLLVAGLLARAVAKRIGLAKSWAPTACLLSILFLSYPFQFGLDRGNLDLWIGFLCLAFAVLYWSQRYWLAAAFLAAATAVKGYPAVLALLFILDRKYKPAWGSVLVAVSLTLVAVLAMPGDLGDTWQGFLANHAAFKRQYIVGAGSMHFSSDLFTAIKILIHMGVVSWSIENILPWYSLVMLGLLLLAVFYALFAEVPKWKKVLLLTVAALFFPHVVNDYKLILLLVPALALVIEPEHTANENTILVILGLVLIPKAYANLVGDASVSCLLNPLLLLALVGMLVCERGVMREAVRQVKPKARWYLFGDS